MIAELHKVAGNPTRTTSGVGSVRSRPAGAARPAKLGRLAFVVVTAAAVLGGSSIASAQLCSWDGTPVLAPPEIEYLDSQPEGLRAPARLAVDSLDFLYITDPTSGAVVVKDASGGVVSVRDGMGSPLAVAVDAFDSIYIGDESTGKVEIFDPLSIHRVSRRRGG